MTRELEYLASRVDEAHRALNEEFEREFPVGARISWLYRDTHIQSGTIEHNSPFGNIAPEMRVLNDRSDKLVWVNLSMKPKRRQDGY